AWVEAAVRWITSDAYDPRIMTGYPNGTFQPNLAITRAQFARLLYREAGAPDVSGLPDHGLSDVPLWVEDAVRWAKANQIMTGYPDGTFGPNGSITRGQVVRAKYRFAGSQDTAGHTPYSFTDVPAWLAEAVTWASHHTLVTGYGDNTFRDGDPITRGQVARLDYRLALGGSPWADFRTAPHTMLFRPPA
ncbi:MAG: S-layer homology domain-containing protein, partial [Actinomycetota bacterium]